MTASVNSISFEAQLDAAPITRTMWLLWLLSAGLIALDGFDFFIIGVAMPFLQRDFGLDAAAMGAVATAAVAGSLIGSLTLGALTDRVGRELMLMVDVAIFVIATSGTALAWNLAALVAFRFLVGLGIGADYPISLSYITETIPARHRGRMVIGAFSFQAVGALLGAITGVAVIQLFRLLYPDPDQMAQMAIHYAWRWMLGVGLLLAIAVAILRLSFSLESPQYLISRGEYAKAAAAATQLLERPITLTAAVEPPPSEPPTYGALFSTEHRRGLILASAPWFLQDIATYGLGIFTPVLIAALAFAEEPDLMVRELNAAQAAAAVDLVLILGFLCAILLIERLGRIRLQIIGFLGMAVGLSLLAGSSFLVAGSRSAILIVLLGFGIFNLMMNAGPNATTFLLSGELFPTAIRATGSGFAAAFAKTGAVAGTFLLPILQQAWGWPPVLIGLAICCLLAAGITWSFQIETSSQSFVSIQALEPEPRFEPE